jgi:hypothetical protein
MKIFVDIDNTICKTESGNYKNSIPIPGNIAKINRLFDEGNEITYWSSRGQSSYIDWYSLTESQLKSWGCLYHVLSLSKPGFGLLIDDRTKRIEEIE